MKTLISLFISSACLLSTALMAQVPIPHQSHVPPAAYNYAPTSIHWLTNYSEAISLAKQAGKPIVILFTGTQWCPPCQELERKVIHNPEFIQAVANKFIFLKAEFPRYVQGGDLHSPYKPLLDLYGIYEYPTMIVIQPNGQLLFTVDTHTKQPAAFIDQLLQGHSQRIQNSYYQ